MKYQFVIFNKTEPMQEGRGGRRGWERKEVLCLKNCKMENKNKKKPSKTTKLNFLLSNLHNLAIMRHAVIIMLFHNIF